MAKKASANQTDIKEMISVEVASNAAEIAEAVFTKMFADAEEKMNIKVSKLIYGGIIATVLLFLSVIVSVWLFMGSYQQHYLDTQAAFTEKTSALETQVSRLESQTKMDMQNLENQQDYTERFLIENKE
jgi:hypothetical protein